MVAEPNTVRGKWIIGRVVEVYPGQDGRVRNMKEKTPTGEYSRQITKIAVIEKAAKIANALTSKKMNE